VKEFASSLNPPPAGPQGTTFWDALVSFANNQSLAEGIAKRIADGPAPQQLPPERVHVNGARLPQQTQPAPQPQPQQPAPQQIRVEFPPDFPAKCAAIDAAADPGKRLLAVVEALQSLWVIPEWRSFLQSLMALIAQDHKDKAITAVSRWLSVVGDNGHISKAAVDLSIANFTEYFPLVREEILKRLPGLAPAQTAAPAAPPAAPAEPPPGSTPPEHVEVQTGPAPELVDVGDDPDVANYHNGG
jgi:hypothetical protein